MYGDIPNRSRLLWSGRSGMMMQNTSRSPWETGIPKRGATEGYATPGPDKSEGCSPHDRNRAQ
jgi:hypothetical protein